VKLIIAGSRGISPSPWNIHQWVTQHNLTPTEIVCGLAKGADLAGKAYAEKYQIPVKEFPADWKTIGHAAGFVRNANMALYADALLALWDTRSHGTAHMIQQMKNVGKPYYVVEFA
jgi:hypothetical protein